MAVTREEVENELERKSASISESISRIRKDLSLPTEPVKSAVRNHPMEVLLGTVAAGIAVGWIVSGRRKQRKKETARLSATRRDAAASEFLQFVRAGRASGMSEEEAVSGALAARTSVGAGRPPQFRSTMTNRLTDYVIDMAEAMIKTGLRLAAREAAVWLAESVRREKPKGSR